LNAWPRRAWSRPTPRPGWRWSARARNVREGHPAAAAAGSQGSECVLLSALRPACAPAGAATAPQTARGARNTHLQEGLTVACAGRVPGGWGGAFPHERRLRRNNDAWVTRNRRASSPSGDWRN
jgi:hypothetical protein